MEYMEARMQDQIEAAITQHAERDAADRIERLRRIIHRYGDRVRMATSARPDWQQEIDEAIAWVADHPEPITSGAQIGIVP